MKYKDIDYKGVEEKFGRTAIQRFWESETGRFILAMCEPMPEAEIIKMVTEWCAMKKVGENNKVLEQNSKDGDSMSALTAKMNKKKRAEESKPLADIYRPSFSGMCKETTKLALRRLNRQSYAGMDVESTGSDSNHEFEDNEEDEEEDTDDGVTDNNNVEVDDEVKDDADDEVNTIKEGRDKIERLHFIEGPESTSPDARTIPMDSKTVTMTAKESFIRDRKTMSMMVTNVLTRPKQYKFAKLFMFSIAQLSGFFEGDLMDWGRWEVMLKVQLPSYSLVHPSRVMLDNVTNLRLTRFNFLIHRSTNRGKYVNYVYVAKDKDLNNDDFVLYADRTFWTQDSVGYLRGEVVWKQSVPTKIKPTLEEIEATNFFPKRFDHVCIRDKDYHWTIQEVNWTVQAGQEKCMYMGMHYIKHSTKKTKINMVVREDGLIVCVKKCSNDTVMVANMPFIGRKIATPKKRRTK